MKPYYQDEQATIYCGKCEEIIPQLELVDIVLTDPPWECSEKSIVRPSTYDNSHTLKRGEVGYFDIEIIQQLEQLANNDCFILAGYKEMGQLLCGVQNLRGIFIWYKPNATLSKFYPTKRMDCSFVIWCGRKSLLYGKYKWPSQIFEHKMLAAGVGAKERFVDDKMKSIHPCQGPISLYMDLLKPFPKELVVLDAYMGTGTTIHAAKNLGMKAIGIEREQKYCDLAIERLRQGVLF